MTAPKDLPSPFEDLQKILVKMSVPLEKMGNVKWLKRNLHTHNARHPEYKQAMRLLDKLTFTKVVTDENV